MKHYVTFDKKIPNKCTKPCPFKNQDISEKLWDYIGTMVGSGSCQQCEHHKNNNRMESEGPNYNISRGGIVWIECEKLDEHIK